jgi:cardiolipin synthase
MAFRRRIELQKSELKASEIPAADHLPAAFRRMVLMLIEDGASILTTNNQIKLYADGSEKFADLIAAIKAARDHVHLEYYIWRNDALSHEMRLRNARKRELKSSSCATGSAVRLCLGIFLMS